jgi:hypothetical protein
MLLEGRPWEVPPTPEPVRPAWLGEELIAEPEQMA